MAVSRSRSAGRQQGPELVGPGQDRPGGDVDPALGQQVADVGGREAVPEIPADGGADHLQWPAVPGERRARAPGEGPSAGAAAEALATRRATVALHRRSRAASAAPSISTFSRHDRVNGSAADSTPPLRGLLQSIAETF